MAISSELFELYQSGTLAQLTVKRTTFERGNDRGLFITYDIHCELDGTVYTNMRVETIDEMTSIVHEIVFQLAAFRGICLRYVHRSKPEFQRISRQFEEVNVF